jgi:hypothetical protein
MARPIYINQLDYFQNGQTILTIIPDITEQVQ